MRSIEEMDQRVREHAAAYATLMAAIAALDVSGEWRATGARNLASFLVGRYEISHATAREWVNQAQTVASLPSLGDALSAGSASTDQIRAIATLSDSDHDAQVWLEVLAEWPIDELQREARKATAHELERRDHGRYLRMGYTPDERFMTIDGRLHPDEGAVVMQAIERTIPPEAQLADWGSWYADGLVQIAGGALSSDADQERATVVIHVDQTAAANGRRNPTTAPREPGPAAKPASRDVTAVPGRTDRLVPLVGELEHGGFVPFETVARCACDARIEYVGHDLDGRITGIDRAGRNIPPWMYRQLRRRDRRCVFPGCGASRFLRGHHIIWWSRGGPTELPNLVLVCGHHHALLHEHQWTLRGEAGPGIQWIQPNGQIYQPRKAAGADGYDTS